MRFIIVTGGHERNKYRVNVDHITNYHDNTIYLVRHDGNQTGITVNESAHEIDTLIERSGGFVLKKP